MIILSWPIQCRIGCECPQQQPQNLPIRALLKRQPHRLIFIKTNDHTIITLPNKLNCGKFLNNPKISLKLCCAYLNLKI